MFIQCQKSHNPLISKDIIKFPLGTKSDRGKIIPVFLPFAGCPYQCIYCSQEKQSGAGNIGVFDAIKQAMSRINIYINIMKPAEKKVELAFYGGTFTALAETDFTECLHFFENMKEKFHRHGIKLYGRCSTRPDCLDEQRLQRMKTCGIDLVELGIQSFNTVCLQKTGRNYTKEIAENACEIIHATGLLLGIQLMPGLPGQEENLGGGTIFIEDVETALSYNPECLRFYPCLVPDDTKLAAIYKEGQYEPWENEYCYDYLAKALALAWETSVPVIRLGVAQEKDFDTSILAGPRHDALGAIVQAKTLLCAYDTAIERAGFFEENNQYHQNIFLTLPCACQGYIFGQKNTLKKEWEQRLPLENIRYISQLDACSDSLSLFATLEKQ